MKLETEQPDQEETVAKKKAGEVQLSFWESSAPSAPSPKKLSKAAATKLVSNLNPEISSIVGSEIINGNLKPATWALALAYSNGSHDQAMTHYARLRLESLSDCATDTRRKEQALEARRRAGFKKMTTPLPRLYLGNLTPPGMRNRKRIALSPLWLLGLWLCGTAACAAVTRYYSENFYLPGSRLNIPASIGVTALLMFVIVTMHLLIPRTRLFLRYAIPLGAWTAACTSCYFGLMILKSNQNDRPESGLANTGKSTERKIIPEETSKVSPPSGNASSGAMALAR